VNEQLVKLIKRYLKDKRALSQNECARRWGMGASTLSELLKGKDVNLTSEQEYQIIETVARWKHDPTCVAGRMLTSLYKQYLSKAEIDAVVSKMSESTIMAQKSRERL
jgi:transcriptional regulator with XRE-family HTH domain